MKKTICDFVGFGSKFNLCDIEMNLCTDCFDKMMDEYVLPHCQNKVVITPYNE